jgi:tripartite-type tricarboxylate transporter receptor subunit TctC
VRSWNQRRRVVAAVLAAGMALGGSARAQGAGPLTLVVPAPAGSAPDIVARFLGEELSTRLSRSVIVDNKPGAGGIVAVMAAKTAMASGANTLLFAHAAVATITPVTYRAAKYDLGTDFEPVAVVADTPMLFVANPTTGPKTLADAISMAKARPDTVVLGSTSRGSIPHLAGVLLGQMAGVSFSNVPMSGSGQAIQAVVGGDSAISVDGIAPLLPLVKSGRLRAVAVTSTRPLAGLESLPLAKDTVPGLELNGWFMLFASKRTPRAELQTLNDVVNAALKSPALVQKLQSTANYPVGGSLADARAFLSQQKKLWAGAAERAGLQPE